MRVNPEYSEHATHQVGVERWLPGGRSGVALVGTTEALAKGDRARDASHFPAELEVVVARANSILMKNADGGDLEREGKRQQPAKKPRKPMSLGKAPIIPWLFTRRHNAVLPCLHR